LAPFFQLLAIGMGGVNFTSGLGGILSGKIPHIFRPVFLTVGEITPFWGKLKENFVGKQRGEIILC